MPIFKESLKLEYGLRMEKIYSNFWNKSLFQISFLIVFCFFLFFVNLGKWDLWNPDEPRYAQVAREMVNGGDWILMHLNGKVYTDKPPLFFWLMGFSSFLWSGFNSFSVRFPSAIFGTLTVVLTFLIGKNLYSSRTGFLSGLVLATSIEFAYLATRANIDATLTFFTTASFYCFVKWYQDYFPHPKGERENVGEKEDKRSIIIYGFYISMALATLTKGPVGFIIPLLVSIIYLIVQKEWSYIRRMNISTGILLFLLIVLSWYVPALIKGGRDYFNETIMLHTVDRFAKGSSHIRPFYYYFYNFPVDFLPWIFFLPSAIILGYSKDMVNGRKEFLFLLTWCIVIFIFFSLSKGKRGIYLLPLFPASALMVGKLWDDFIWSKRDGFLERFIIFPLFGFIGLNILAAIGSIVVISVKFPNYLLYVLPLSIIIFGGSILIFLLYMKKKRGVILLIIIMMMGGGFFYLGKVVFPMVNPYKSARFISQEITSRINPGERLAIYGDFVFAPYNYYTGIVPIIELEDKEDFVRFLQSKERVFCLLKFRDFVKLQTMIEGLKVEFISRRIVGGDDMVLISNR